MPFRCSGPHAQYTDEVNESFILSKCGHLFSRKGGEVVMLLMEPWSKGLGNLADKLHRAGDRSLIKNKGSLRGQLLKDFFNKLLVFNEEILVSAGHQPALTASLLFVHTARRFYWLDAMAKSSEQSSRSFPLFTEWGRDESLFCFGTLKSFKAARLTEPYHLEEKEVVTRYP